MARLLGGLHSHTRGRSNRGAQTHLPKARNHALSVLLACTILLAISALLASRFSIPRNDYHSAGIGILLSELDEQIRDAGEDAPQLQLRLLRLAAGVKPDHPDRAARVFSELLSNIETHGNTLPCVIVDAVQGPQNSTGCSKGCFFALNLFKSNEVLPNMILQLLAVLGSLGGGAHAQRCFVSAYDSGSTDAKSLMMLDTLRQILDLLGVPNSIRTSGWDEPMDHHELHRLRQLRRQQHGRWWLRWGGPRGEEAPGVGDDDARTSLMADLRNEVLRPLLVPPPIVQRPCSTVDASGGAGCTAGISRSGTSAGSSSPLQMERVISIDDVFFCATDVRRLLRYDSADVACAMDFAPADLWLLTQLERERLMADHLAAGMGVPRRWAEGLSRTWLPYRVWVTLYGKSHAFWPWSFPVFHSMWVSRDVSGGRIRNRQPYSLEPWTADRLAQGLPTPMYACWNGLVNVRAEPLLRGTHGSVTPGSMADRPSSPSSSSLSSAVASAASIAAEDGNNSEGGDSGDPNDDTANDRGAEEEGAGAAVTWQLPPVQFRSHRPGECAASSECSLLCDDLHAAGFHRVLLEPNVRVAYDWSAALSLYGNFKAAENAPGLRYRPMAAGDARQVEISWDDDWLPRVKAGARSVECCDIQPGPGPGPGRQVVARSEQPSDCSPRDMWGPWGWGSGEPAE